MAPLLVVLSLFVLIGDAFAQTRCDHYCEYNISKDGVNYSAIGHVNYTCSIGWPDWGCENVKNEILGQISPNNLSNEWGSIGAGCGNIHSYIAVITNPTPTPSPTVTATPTKTATPTPTRTPTPTVVVTASSVPTVDAGGPYVKIACVPGLTSVQLLGKASTSNSIAEISWSSNCPNGTFNNVSSVSPVLNFKAATSDNKPVNCLVKVTAKDSFQNIATDTAEIAVGSCDADCTGTISGTAKTDACGVCLGDGSSCACNSVNITETQHAADVAAALQRNLILIANKTIQTANRKASPAVKAKLKLKLDAFSNQAHALYDANWRIAYSNPNVILQCAATANCVKLSNVSIKATYLDNSVQFTKILAAQRKLLSPTKAKKAHKKLGVLINKSKVQEKNAVSALGNIPDSRDAC